MKERGLTKEMRISSSLSQFNIKRIKRIRKILRLELNSSSRGSNSNFKRIKRNLLTLRRVCMG